MWRTCRQLHFLFYDKSLIVLQKIIKNMANWIDVNEILLYRRSRARPIGVTQPRGHVQTGYVVRLA
jgi:hypothetical protein